MVAVALTWSSRDGETREHSLLGLRCSCGAVIIAASLRSNRDDETSHDVLFTYKGLFSAMVTVILITYIRNGEKGTIQTPRDPISMSSYARCGSTDNL